MTLTFDLNADGPVRDFVACSLRAAGGNKLVAAVLGRNEFYWSRRLKGVPRQRQYKHGTRYAYTRGCRCAECRTANTHYHRDLRDARAGALAPDDPRHGHNSTYNNHRCRCEPCKAAHAEVMADRAHLIREDRHGTYTNYAYGCRCESCKAARRNYAEDRRARQAVSA